eukprot:scaffold1687_cov405-Prasinococcus_capsulatus_cf.AAC.3
MKTSSSKLDYVCIGYVDCAQGLDDHIVSTSLVLRVHCLYAENIPEKVPQGPLQGEDVGVVPDAPERYSQECNREPT